MSQKVDKKPKAKIGHSLQQLEDGLILTLQDKPILQDGKINEQDDIFQNFQKRKQNEQEHNRQLREKLKTIANAATSHIEAKNQGLKSLLPHYDDYRYKNDQVDLEDGSVIKRSRPKPTPNTVNDFQPNNPQNTKSEYYRRPTIKSRNLGKQKTSNSGELLAFLNETALEKKDDENEEIQKSAAEIIDQSLNTVRKRRDLQRGIGNISEVFVTEQDELLAKAIQKSRQRKEKEKLNVMDIIKQQGQEEDANRQYKEIELKPVNYTSKKLDKIDKKYNINDAAKGTTSCMFVNLPSENLVKKEQPMPQSFKDITPEELQKMKQELQFMEDQKMGIGLADTLKFLRQNKLLQKQQQFGRTNDEQADYNKPGDRVKLEYRNASGQLMKPKQAFRYMSAIFHGHGPGKNKIQKIKKKQLLQMRIKQSANSQGKLMGLLDQHQSKTGEAHMVLEFGTKFKKEE